MPREESPSARRPTIGSAAKDSPDASLAGDCSHAKGMAASRHVERPCRIGTVSQGLPVRLGMTREIAPSRSFSTPDRGRVTYVRA
jgi:hypothetical protein